MEKNKKQSLAETKSIILYRNKISKKQIDEVFEVMVNLFKFYFPNIFKWLPKKISAKIWNKDIFHRSILQARKKSKIKFGKVYDTIQLSYPLKKLMTSDNLMRTINKYSSLKEQNFICFNSLVRFDPPFDNRNTVDWHYDLYPNSLTIDPVNGLTVVVAFHDTKIVHGAPIFLLNSSKSDIKMFLKKGKNNKSDKYLLNKKTLNKYKRKIFEIKSGDILVFPMKTIHKSGENISNKVRISGLFRYYPISKKGFTSLKETYVPTK